MPNQHFKTQKEVIDFLNKTENNVKFVKVIFSDVLGREMNFCFPAEKIKSAFSKGVGFDGSSVEGFARIEESDLVIVPDPKTFKVLPWEYQAGEVSWKEAIVFGDIFTPKKKHYEGDSRYALKKVLKETENIGKLFVGPEIEFFIFENQQDPKLLDHGGYFYKGKMGEIRKLTQIYLHEMGIKTSSDHHEVSPSQHEIVLQYDDALTIADSVVLTKYIIKRVARKLGLFASFMPKPITDQNGSGMHLHLSLEKESKNIFFDKKNKSLSILAQKYIAGLIKEGKEIQLALNQWVNSYKRLIPGYEAPVYLSWGRRNRSAYIRAPETHLAKPEKSTRIEIRSPDPACNIYLALAIIQAAGISGIRKDLKLFPLEETNIFEMPKKDMKKKKIRTLSKNLKEALKEFKDSQLAKKTLSNHLYQKMIQNAEIQWQEYKKAVKDEYKEKVSPYEIKKYLPIL